MIGLSSDFFAFPANAKKVSHDEQLNQEHTEFHPLIPSVHSFLYRIGNLQDLLKCRLVASFGIMRKNAPALVTKKMLTEGIDNEQVYPPPLIHLNFSFPAKNFSARHSRWAEKKAGNKKFFFQQIILIFALLSLKIFSASSEQNF